MSSILDSLRKSDQKRKNKQASSIDDLRLGNNKTGGSGRARLIFWLILLLLLAATVFWSWRNGLLHQWLGLTTNTDTSQNMEITQDQTPEQSTDQTAAQGQSEQSAEQIATQPQLAQRPDPEAVKESALTQRMQAAASQRSQANPPSIDQSAAQPAPPAGDIPQELREKAEESAEEQLAILENARNNNPQQTPPPTRQPEAQPQAPERSYKFIYELPFSIRKDLPEIKLNIHVYDPDPENRMAVINGLRYSMGDLIEDTIKIQDVIQEGVVLEYEGQVFMLPK